MTSAYDPTTPGVEAMFYPWGKCADLTLG